MQILYCSLFVSRVLLLLLTSDQNRKSKNYNSLSRAEWRRERERRGGRELGGVVGGKPQKSVRWHFTCHPSSAFGAVYIQTQNYRWKNQLSATDWDSLTCITLFEKVNWNVCRNHLNNFFTNKLPSNRTAGKFLHRPPQCHDKVQPSVLLYVYNSPLAAIKV